MPHVPRLYTPDCAGVGALTLSPEQSRRLADVMRVRTSEPVLLFAGDGIEWQATVVSVAKRSVTVAVEQMARQEQRPHPAIEVCFPLVRSNRLDWLIEKAVECGVDVLQPANFEHSARGDAPSANRSERWQRIAVEAAEQSGRLFVPAFRDAVNVADVLRRASALIVADRSGQSWPLLQTQLTSAAALTIVIGPEGGLSDPELDTARAAGAAIVSLGPNILRAETAAVIATALIRALPPR